MSIEIIKPRRMVEDRAYFLEFVSNADAGYGFLFPCSEDGKVEQLTDMQFSSFVDCTASGNFFGPVITSTVNRYAEAAEARCLCGRKIYLEDPRDNECDDCGRNYNMAGQEVIPMYACRDHDDY